MQRPSALHLLAGLLALSTPFWLAWLMIRH